MLYMKVLLSHAALTSGAAGAETNTGLNVLDNDGITTEKDQRIARKFAVNSNNVLFRTSVMRLPNLYTGKSAPACAT